MEPVKYQPMRSYTKKILVFMNEKIKSKCGREAGKCIVVQQIGSGVNVEKLEILDRNSNVVAVVKVSVQSNPDIKTHNVHGWIEIGEGGSYRAYFEK